MLRYRLGSVVAIAVLAALLMAQAATAASINDIFNDYQKNGQINACKYSPSDLQRAGSQLPSDVEQYSPSFADQLNAARGQQCGGGGSQSTSAGGPTSGGGGGGGGSGGAGGGASAGKVTKPPAPPVAKPTSLANVPAPAVSTAAASSGTSAGRPDSLIVLLIAAAALVLIGALVARRLGFHPIQKIRGTGPPHPAPSGQ
jgi:hypothetical protein